MINRLTAKLAAAVLPLAAAAPLALAVPASAATTPTFSPLIYTLDMNTCQLLGGLS